MELILTRFQETSKSTIGRLEHNGNLLGFTLELPWKNNQRQISCIPKGIYKVVPRFSPKYKNHFHILDVPNRTFILIHVGNYPKDSLGCVLFGTNYSTDMVGNSRAAMQTLLTKFPKGFTLTIQ